MPDPTFGGPSDPRTLTTSAPTTIHANTLAGEHRGDIMLSQRTWVTDAATLAPSRLLMTLFWMGCGATLGFGAAAVMIMAASRVFQAIAS